MSPRKREAFNFAKKAAGGGSGTRVEDLLRDAEHAELQAEKGPFYPERGVTPEALKAYATRCRKAAERPAL